jgi:hypothetical protein
MPFDKMAGRVAAMMMRVGPCLAVEPSGAKIVLEQIRGFIGEELHAAIGVMNDEPFKRPKQLVGDNQRSPACRPIRKKARG